MDPIAPFGHHTSSECYENEKQTTFQTTNLPQEFVYTTQSVLQTAWNLLRTAPEFSHIPWREFHDEIISLGQLLFMYFFTER
jgi:hypothetical protein